MIDLHSHVLPNVDDGSRSVQESLEMLRMEQAQGIGCVFATPHFYADRDTPDKFLQRRNEGETLLREAMEQEETLPTLRIGAEVRYYSGMSHSEALHDLALDGGRYLLLEMPFSQWTPHMYSEVRNIYERQQLTPVIAHLERYISRLNAHKILEKLADTPALIQVNSEFFLNKFTRKMAFRMLQNQQIHLLGSDCHNTSSRKPNLGEAILLIRNNLGEDALQFVEDHAAWLY